MAINVHIDKLEVGNLHLSSSPASVDLAGELLRGVSPEQLQEIGHQIPAGVPEAPIDDAAAKTPEDERREEARMQALAESTEPIPDHIKPNVRKEHLYKALRTASDLGRITGAVTTHQETSLKDLPSAEDALEGYTENLARSLEKACGACAFKGACRLEGNPDAWRELHPDQAKVTRRTQQSRQEFKGALAMDPMTHCVPAKQPKRAK